MSTAQDASTTPAGGDAPSLRKSTAKGMAFLGVTSIASRVILFGSQIILGWILLPEDFGVSAIAFTVATIAWTFVGFGVDDILMQRGRTIHKWERAVFIVSLAMGLGIAAVIFVLAPIFGNLFDEPTITGLLWVAALSMAIGTPSTVSMVKVRAKLDFAWLAGIDALHVLIGQGFTIIFALLGFGAYAFFLPLPIQQIVRTCLLWRRAPPSLGGRTKWLQMKTAAFGGVKVFATRVAEAIIQQADYFILGLFAATNLVGFYSFAFRLAAVPIRVLGFSLRAVLVPTLTHLKGDEQRMARASLEASELLAYLVAPLCFFQAAVAGPALGFFFGDKWDQSVPIIQILSIGLPAEALLEIARARMTALGQFQRALNYAAMSAFAFVVFATTGSALGDHIGLAIAVSAYTMIVSPLIFFRVFNTPGEYVKNAMNVFGKPFAAAAVAALAGYLAGGAILDDPSPLVELIVVGSMCTVFYAGLVVAVSPQMAQKLLGVIKMVIGRVTKRGEPKGEAA